MARWLENTSCPHCGSKDNLAVYDDGSKWCWGCRYYEPAQGLQRVKSILFNKIDTNKSTVMLPPDSTYKIEDMHISWLRNYGITNKEIIKFGLMSCKEGLVFPVLNKDILIYYQIRRFNQVPKVRGVGKKPLVIYNPNNITSEYVVVVEDPTSAMKISRVCPVVPLFGTYLSMEAMQSLSKRFSKLVVWLDADKSKEGLRQATRGSWLFKGGFRIVRTELDPKCYNELQIDKEIKGNV